MYDTLELQINQTLEKARILRRKIYPAWRPGADRNYSKKVWAVLPNDSIVLCNFRYTTHFQADGTYIKHDSWNIDTFSSPCAEELIRLFNKTYTGSEIEQLAWEGAWRKHLKIGKLSVFLVEHVWNMKYLSALRQRQATIHKHLKTCYKIL